MLLLPSVSADYKLLLVYLPLVLFLNTEEEGKLILSIPFLFALLLIPITYYFLPTVVSENKIHEISIGVVMRIVDMLVFCLVIIGSGIWKRRHPLKNNWINGTHQRYVEVKFPTTVLLRDPIDTFIPI